MRPHYRPEDDEPARHRRKPARPRPWRVQCFSTWGRPHWWTWGRYTTKARAVMAITALRRAHRGLAWQWRIWVKR